MDVYDKYIRTVNDFPIKGIKFRDITPLLANAGRKWYTAWKNLLLQAFYRFSLHGFPQKSNQKHPEAEAPGCLLHVWVSTAAAASPFRRLSGRINLIRYFQRLFLKLGQLGHHSGAAGAQAVHMVGDGVLPAAGALDAGGVGHGGGDLVAHGDLHLGDDQRT